ncbi:MAG: reverse transcriptase-like protein [Alphaproteobacteria bacterium]|nr:reverse transcriptase-like protein [Alphaproteobacteria bacterium]
MISENQRSKANKSLIKPFRRTGPLDAYIYKQGANEEDIHQVESNVQVLPRNSIENKVHVSDDRKETIMHVFTDGACPGNGKRNANAAWGCLLVSDDGYIVLERLSGAIPLSETQTNQRAELTALLRGLELAEKQLSRITDLKKVQIWSDSEYSINCASVWGPKWKSKGWTKQGGEIQHLDLIRVLVEKTLLLGFKIEYRWLKGHKGGESQYAFPWMFNHQVDALANSALR